jgi:transposase
MVTELTTDIETLDDIKKVLTSFSKKEEAYKAEIKILKEQIRSLQDKIFGRKTEKIHIDDGQLYLFDFPEPQAPAEDTPEEDITIGPHKRKKRGRKAIPDHLPRVEVIHDLKDDEKQCQCGCEKSYIGEDVSEQLDIIPSKMRVIRNIRYKYACKNCEGVDDDGPTVVIAPMPEQIIPKSIATPGLIAHVLTAKFVDALPFYRQEKQFKRMDIEIPRATMCGWAIKAADACEILLQMFKNDILSGPLINIDETTVQVLNEPGKTPQSKSYMWVFRGGPPGKSSVLFQYHPTRSGDVPALFLKGYKGIVQTDGYSGYNFLDHTPDILHVGCLAHARRKFMDVTKAARKIKKKKQKTGNADIALNYIGQLYKIEKDVKGQNLSPDELYELRQKKSVPILNEFKKWLEAIVDKTPPKGLLGKAIKYSLNQWHRISAYTEDGIIRLDNNVAENAVRPFVIGRKNWLFNSTPEGASASADLYSLIETAKANELEPYAYLKYLFTHIPNAMTTENFRALMPQYLDKSKISKNN